MEDYRSSSSLRRIRRSDGHPGKETSPRKIKYNTVRRKEGGMFWGGKINFFVFVTSYA